MIATRPGTLIPLSMASMHSNVSFHFTTEVAAVVEEIANGATPSDMFGGIAIGYSAKKYDLVI